LPVIQALIGNLQWITIQAYPYRSSMVSIRMNSMSNGYDRTWPKDYIPAIIALLDRISRGNR
jgi:hypothetical protein